MVGVTDSHCLYFYSLLNAQAHLFTQMYPAQSVIRRPDRSYLAVTAANPVVVQIAASNAEVAVQAAQIIQPHNYCELNLNLGCPSSSANKGSFGACQWLRPLQVVSIYRALAAQFPNWPISLKLRLGADDSDSWQDIEDFIGACVQAGVSKIYVHARKALLNGISPLANRNIPSLRADYFAKLCLEFPDCDFIYNGGVTSVDEAHAVTGTLGWDLMCGRLIQLRPWVLLTLQKDISRSELVPLMHAAIDAYQCYADEQLQVHQGGNLFKKEYHRLVLPLIAASYALPDGKAFRIQTQTPKTDLANTAQQLHECIEQYSTCSNPASLFSLETSPSNLDHFWSRLNIGDFMQPNLA